MNRWTILIAIVMIGAFAFSSVLIVPSLVQAGKIEEVIDKTPKGTGKGEIDLAAKKGFLGIPGGPSPSLLVAFLWAALCGWTTGTIGAFGAVFAGVGHMSFFGLGDYAKTFAKTNLTLNKLVTDSIRVSNQLMVGTAATTYAVNYLRLKRVVIPLGIALIIGGVGGGILIPILTAGKLTFAAYQGWFGLFILSIVGLLIYETTPAGLKRKKAVKEASETFLQSCKLRVSKGEISEKDLGVKLTKVKYNNVELDFCDVHFKFNPIWAIVAGLVVASISAFLGVGGGFLYVPFMTSAVGLPMYVITGTSGFVMTAAMAISIFSFIVLKGVVVDWAFVGLEMLGCFVGAMIAPRTQKYIPDVWLKRLFAVFGLYVGIKYIGLGFFGQKWLP